MPGAKDASDEREPGAILTGIRIIFQTTPVTFAGLLIVAAVRGLVPAIAAVMAGRAVTAIPAAIEAGGLHDGGRDLAVAVIGVAMVYGADQIVGALMFPIEEGWAMHLYGRIEQRALSALASPPLLDHFLDPETRRLADVAVKQDWPHIAPFATACLWGTTWLVGAASQAVVLAQFSLPLALATTALWFAAGVWMRQQDLVGLWTAILGQRFAQYLRWFTMRNENAAELRLFGAAPWFIDRFDNLTRASYREAWKVRAATARVLGPLLVLLVVGNAAGIAVISHAAYVGDITVAQLAMFALVFVGLSELALPQEWTERLLWGASRLPSLVALEKIGQRETQRATPATPIEVPTSSPTIRLDGVSFAYRGRPDPIIRDLDLIIDGGTSLAIVGDNGAGKTTLVRLLCRLHDPSAGHITVDGNPLTALDPVAWQRSVAAVFQDSIRYPLTVAETVALGPVTDADLPALIAAAEAVGSRDVIDSLARGWDTVLSRRFKDGLELSGGQWQRIALVRAAFALQNGARLLILDEPTANLDVRGEAELYDRFVDLARGATTVLVSHRFSTVRRADRIVVLDHGRIVEDGSHAELMRHDGRYATLFRIQASRYGQAVTQ